MDSDDIKTEAKATQKPKKVPRIGKYVLLAKIATGGMAEIFLARTEGPAGFEKLLVIKRILSHYAQDEQFVEMFLDEARIAARLDHPNIVQIYDMGQVDRNFFIAMEYLPGAAFSDLVLDAIQNRRRLDQYFCAALIAQVCDGLQFAHTACLPDGTPMQVVHRDINPRNLVVTFSGTVKIVDFGVAKAKGRMTSTHAGGIKGTFPYMSPEQCRGEEIDHRSDLFSLGTVFYELMAQKRLFKRSSEMAILKAITQEDIPSLRDERPDLDPNVERIIERALNKDCELRYQNARDMQRDLFTAMDMAKARVNMSEIADYMNLHLSKQRERHRAILEKIQSEVTGSGSDPSSVVSHDTEVDIPGSDPYGGTILSFVGADPQLSDAQATALADEHQARTLVQPEAQSQHKPSKPGRKGFWLALGVIGLILLAVVIVWVAGSGSGTQADSSDAGTGGTGTTDAPTLGSLIVETDPAGATLVLDGKEISDKTPVALKDLSAGKPVSIRVSLAGYRSVERTEEVLARTESRIRLILVPLPSSLELVGAPDGALVKLGGQVKGTIEKGRSFKLELNPGQEYSLRVEKAGHRPFSQKVKLARGESSRVEVALERKKLSYGTLEVNCVPWCKIFVDGRDIGRNSPAKEIRLSTGRHRLRVINPPTGLSQEQTIQIKKNANTRKVIRLR